MGGYCRSITADARHLTKQKVPVPNEEPVNSLWFALFAKGFPPADANFVHKPSGKILVQHAGDERLVGYPFLLRIALRLSRSW